MTAVPALARSLGRSFLRPGSPGYDLATDIPFATPGRSPLAAARPTSTREVATIVRGAREAGAPLAVRSGGHSRRGIVDGALTLDMRGLDQLSMDPDSRIATVGGGVLAADYLAAAHEHGLTTGFGDAPTVGIAGITLGGGVGFLTRRDGLSIDNLRSAEVVLADGSVIMAGPDEHPELFWALRGGGGNFGVVTQLSFDLHPAGTVAGGMLAVPATAEVLAGAIRAVRTGPRELGAMLNLMAAPPVPWLPERLHGTPVLVMALCYSGAPEDAPSVLDPLRQLGEPALDTVGPTPYPELIKGPPPAPAKLHPVVRSGFVDGADASWAAAALEALGRRATDMAAVQIRFLGGAVAEVAEDATAFAHRQREATVAVVAATADPGQLEPARQWADATEQALGLTGRYPNFLSDPTTEEDVAAAYPGETLTRLREVKRAYDPDNTFFSALNIAPL
ncbi:MULTISPECIES: FAD-binding oxidoreductase [unclassified Brachybacterium]|uniref:FAD-binding oxidoreductase n=1 Tax=unclassified Brachybacterium TaxID=2623841 RepID=UPI00360813FE